MTFDVEAALRDGYTEDEVADFLAQKNRFDSARARQDGYSAREIIDHLQGQKEVAFDAVTGTTAAMSKDTADPLGAGKTLIAGISRLPSELAATAIQTAKGQSGATVTDKGILDRFLEQNAKDREEFIKQYGSEAQILPGIPISVKDVAELPSNLAFSGTSAVTGLAAGVATALATKSPALAWTAGGAASGTMAYRATANQIMQQYLEAMNETSREKFGRDITPEEEEKLKSKFSNLATAYGLYEAIPEAIGNVAELRIITKPLAKMVGKDLAAEIVKRIMKTYGMELSTETITQIGQQRVESEAGLTDEAPRSFTSPSDIAKSAAEVAPQVFLLTTVMGGAAAGGTAIYRKYSSRKVSQIIQDGAEQAEQIPDDQIDTVIKGAEEVQKRRPNDEKLKDSVDVIKKEKKRRTKEAPVEGKAEEVAPMPALPQGFFDDLRTYLVDGKDKNGNPFDIDHVRSFREKYASQPKANPESIRMLDQFLEDMELGNVTKPTEDTTQLMHSLRADAMQGLPMDQLMARGDELKGRHPQLTDEINKLIIEFQGKAIKTPEAVPATPVQTEDESPVIPPTEATETPAAPTPAQPEIVAPGSAGEAVAPSSTAPQEGFTLEKQHEDGSQRWVKTDPDGTRHTISRDKDGNTYQDFSTYKTDGVDSESGLPVTLRITYDNQRGQIFTVEAEGENGERFPLTTPAKSVSVQDVLKDTEGFYGIKKAAETPPAPSQEKVSEEVKSLILHDMRTQLEEGYKYGMRDDETAGQGSNVVPIGTTNPPWLMDIVREMKKRHQQTIGKAEIQAVIRKEIESNGRNFTPKQLKIWFIIEEHLRNESFTPHYIRAAEVMSGAKDALVDEFSNRLEAGEYDNAFSDLSFPPTEKEIEVAAANVVSNEVANGNEDTLQTYTAERGEAHREENAPTAEKAPEEVNPKTEKTEAGEQGVILGASFADTFDLTPAQGEIGTPAPTTAPGPKTATVEEVAASIEAAKPLEEMSVNELVKNAFDIINAHIKKNQGMGFAGTQILNDELFQALKPTFQEMARRAKQKALDIKSYIIGAVNAMEEGTVKDVYEEAAARYVEEEAAPKEERTNLHPEVTQHDLAIVRERIKTAKEMGAQVGGYEEWLAEVEEGKQPNPPMKETIKAVNLTINRRTEEMKRKADEQKIREYEAKKREEEKKAEQDDFAAKWDAMGYGPRQDIAEVSDLGTLRKVVHRISGSKWAELSPGEQESMRKAAASMKEPKPEPAPEAKPTQDLATQLFRGFNLRVTKDTTKNGNEVWNVSGATKFYKEQLKQAGGRWYGPKKVWSFYKGDPTEKILGILRKERPAEAKVEEPKAAKKPWEMTGEEFAESATVNRGNNYIAVESSSDGSSFVIRTLDTSKYTDADAIAASHKDYISKAIEKGLPVPENVLAEYREMEKEEAPETALTNREETAYRKVAVWVRDKIRKGESFTREELFDKAAEDFGGTIAEGKFSAKDAYDSLELGINQYIDGLSKLKGDLQTDSQTDVKEQVSALKWLNNIIPTQTTRTAEMDEFQQFSTPPAFAYVANWVANIKDGETYLEPSAGTGNLAVFGKVAGARVIVNEISPRRVSVLKELGFARIHTENAEQLNNVLPDDIKPTVVVMNPPFSATAGRMQGQRKTINGATHIEQALKRLEPGGRLVAIVGEGMAADRPAFKEWWKKIKSEYTVKANIGVSGQEYKKYGTTFDNQLLVIDKTGKTEDNEITGKVSKVEDLIPLLEGVRDARTYPGEQKPTQPRGEAGAEEARPAARPDKPVLPATGGVGPGQSVRSPGQQTPKQPGKPAGVEPGEGGAVSGTRPERGEARPGAVEQGEGTGGVGGSTLTGSSRQPAEADAGIPEVSGLTVEQKLDIEKEVEELSDSVFDAYKPAKLSIPSAQPHPGKLVESAAMASVEPIDPTYQPHIPEKIIKEGKVSLAQLEAVVYAGQAHGEFLPSGERKGYFIGDGTGVGKGREIAAILWDNFNQGRKKALWISQNSPLIKDAARDIEGVGWDSNLLFDVGKTKLHSDIHQTKGIGFVGYGTLKMEKSADGKKVSRLQQIAKWLGEDFDGVIAFDESHNMGNAVSVKGKRGMTKPSATALAGIELQKLLPKARVLYVSATGATEVMNLAYATRLGLWGDKTPFSNAREFVQDISGGGIGIMEMVAQNMKAMGVYTARSLAYDDVKYGFVNHTLTEQQREVYDEMAGAWQGVLRDINAALRLTGVKDADTGRTMNGQAVAAAMSKFWGTNQRFWNQIITAMQMPSVVSAIEKDMQEGHSSVVQLVNTNEAAQERAIARLEEGEELEDLDLTPRDALMEYVKNSFPVQQFEEYMDDEGNVKSRPVVDSQGNPVENREAVAMREALLNRLGSIRVPDGPLEILLNHFSTDNVAEVTGRTRRVVYKQTPEGKKRVSEPWGKNKGMADADQFMDGKKRILVFSYAGGTGRSYHADLTAKNQQMRKQYLVQAGWRADRAVQGLGRTHRTNQKQAPEWILVTTDLQGQKRFISSIARRLDQLGALTRGERKAGSQGLFSARDNLESQEAREALRQLIVDMHHGDAEMGIGEFENATGLTGLIDPNTGALNESKLPDIAQFLNRILNMKIADQDKVFGMFSYRHDMKVAEAIRRGTLDEGMQTIRAKRTEKIQEQVVYRDEKTKAETKYVEVELTHDAKRMDYAQSRLYADNGYVRNIKSGRVWALGKQKSTTDTSTGEVKLAYVAVGANYNYHNIPVDETNDPTKYEKIPKDKSEKPWNDEFANMPAEVKERVHMVTGAILPIWDRLPAEGQKVYRLNVDGRNIIGRVIPKRYLPETLKSLGAQASKTEYKAPDIFANVLHRGYKYRLSNNWRIERKKVAGDYRIELIGPYYGHMAELGKYGIFEERISYQTRYFIPAKAETGTKAIEEIISSRPVTEEEIPHGAKAGEVTEKDIEAGNVNYSVRDLHRRGLLKPAKLEDVKKFFPGQEVGLDANKNIYVKTRGGKYVTIHKVDHIEANPDVLTVGYGTSKLAPGAVIPGAMGMKATGEYYIKLHRVYGDVWTMAHEGLGHFLEVSGITNSLDVAALRAHIKRLHREGNWTPANKKDIGGAEDRANFIADRLAVKEQRGPIGRIILRIRAFIDGILETFGVRSPESIIRGIESGRIFERTGREGKGTNPNIMFEVMTPELPDFMTQYLDSKAEAVEKEFKPFAFDEKSSKNEGLFQLHPSKEFKDFRRVDSWYGVPMTDGVYFVVGTREGYREPQAIRFNKAKFTEAQAKDWWERHKKQFSTVNLYRPKAIEMPAFEPGKVNDWLNNETELNVQHILKREKDLAKKTAGRMKPSNLPHNTWLENMLKSFEWMEHPVLSRIVKIMMSTRSELYHENFNFMTDNKVIEETRALRRKGLSRADRAMGKTSEEYQLLGKMIDYLDLYWKRNKKQTREEQMKAQEDWMRANGATADIIKVWKLHRETYDKGLDLMTAQMRTMIHELDERAKATGEDVSKLKQTLEYHLAHMDEWKGSYAPRVRARGSWWVWAHRGEGERKEYVMDFRGSSMAADRLASKLKEQGWTVSRVEESKQLPEEIQQQIKTVAVARAIEKALEDMKANVKGQAHNDLIMKFNEELLENVADEIKARGFRSSMIHRNTDRIVKGYKEDPLERLVIYTNNTSAGLAKATTAKMAVNELFGERDEETGEHIGGIDPVKDKRTFATAQLYMEEQLRNADQTDRLIAIAKAIATFKYLGFNLRSAFVNTTALATTAPPAIQQYALDGKVGFHKIMNALAAASKDCAIVMAGGKLSNPEEQAFLDKEKRLGWDDAQYTREAMGSIQRTQHRALSLAMDASMYVFGKTEQWNRKTTMLAAYRLARKQGFSPDEAADRAHEASNKAHGIYGKATMPSWAMGRNPLAKVGQLAYVYAKFGHNYLQMLYDLGMKKKNIGAFTYAMLAPLVVGGMAAFPFREQLFAMAGFILRALFGEDRDPEKWVWDQIRKQFGSTGEAIGRHGITGYLGLDISSSLSIGVGVPKGLGDLAGPAGGVAEDVAEAWRYARQGQAWRSAEKLAPRALENPLKALRESREGAVTKHGYRVWDEKGKPFVPTDLEAGARAFGFRSARQAVISERTNESTQEIRAYTDRKASIYERYRAYLSGKKDPAEHRAILKDVREFNEGLRKSGVPKEEVPRITFESMRRQAQRMRKPTKQQRAMLD